MTNHSAYGKQPFHSLLRREGRSIYGVGRYLGFNPGYAWRVAVGRVPPSDAFREALSKHLQRPVTELFTPEALAADYTARKNARGLRRLDAGDAR